MDSYGCPDKRPDPFPYWILAIVAIIPVIGIVVWKKKKNNETHEKEDSTKTKPRSLSDSD